MASNISEFRAALEEWIGNQVPEVAVAVHQKVSLQALAGVVRKSPVDTGRFRANWQVSVNAPNLSEIEATEASPRGSNPSGRQIGEAATRLEALKPYGITYIQNNLPYALRLETGYSKQAPQGMVALTLAELQQQFVDGPEQLGP